MLLLLLLFWLYWKGSSPERSRNQSDTEPAIEKTKQTEAGAALLSDILPKANVLEAGKNDVHVSKIT